MIPEYLNIGSSDMKRKGCLNVDINWDLLKKIDVAGDMMALPFKNNVFKGVLASQVFEHVAVWGHEACIRECWRVLKPNGRLFIEVPDFDMLVKNYSENFLGQKKKWMEHMFGRQAYKGDEHRWGITEDYLTELLFELGFVNLKWERGSRRRPTLAVYATRAELPEWEI